MSTFQDRVALVTGGTSGIGRATAVAFAKAGAKVVVAGRRAEEGQETVRRVEAVGGTGLFVQADVGKDADVAGLVRTAVERFGRVDVAFNNAGVDEALGAFHEKTEADFDKIFGVNVKGLWLSMVHEVRQMLRQGGRRHRQQFQHRGRGRRPRRGGLRRQQARGRRADHVGGAGVRPQKHPRQRRGPRRHRHRHV
jgi:NAD(P)-dependent dehydrogenase (short-subunit alcohol dehydrogenase family)